MGKVTSNSNFHGSTREAFIKTASQDLMNEHKAILIALDVIEKMYERAGNNQMVDIKDIGEMIEFLRIFADKCHHGKEEDFLFPALEEVGFKKQGGPIGFALEEHRRGRELIKRMQRSIENQSFDKDLFIEAASSYVSLLRDHIRKEDTLMFPAGDEKLSESKQEELIRQFESLEKEVIGDGVHEKLHILLEDLSRKYDS